MIADRIRSIQAVSGGGGGGFDPSQLQNLFAIWNTNAPATLWSSSTGGTNPSVSGDSVIRISSSGDTVNDLVWGSALRYSLWSYGNLSFLSDPNSGFNYYDSANISKFEYVTIFLVGTLIDNYSNFGAGFSTTQFAFGVNSGFYSLIIGTNVSGSTTTFRSNIPIDGKPHVFCAKIGCPENAAIDGTFQMWIDGVEVSLTAANPVGTRFYNLNGVIKGMSRNSDKVCEWVVYSRNLTVEEVSQVNDYLLTKWANLLNADSLLLNMQGTPGGTTFVDESPNALAVTPVGDAQLVSDATFGTVASFDGAGDYLRGIDELPLTADWTIEGWYYHTGGTGYRAIFSTRTQTDGGFNNSIWFGVTDTNKLYFDGSTSGALKIIGATTVASGTWYHVCVVRQASVVNLYLNGVSEGTVTDTNSKSTSGFWIGGQFDRYFLSGSLGPLRITKGVARYTANFTPPTGLFPAS